MSGMITLRVNDGDCPCPVDSTVATLLERMQLGGRSGLAVAVNDRVIPARARESHRLLAGDEVLIIQATQGG